MADTPAMKSPESRAARARRIVMLTYPGGQILDVTGPLEVFAIADSQLGNSTADRPGYAIELVAAEAGPVAMSSGLRLVADRAMHSVRGPVDTLIVAGGTGTAEAVRDPELLSWIRRTARRSRRVASVCSGAILLAEAGLLDGKRATTHWAYCERMAATYPRVRVDADPIYVRDGNVYTSAGVTAGMDLALALVEEDHGRDLALAVARRLVLFLKRPGGQSQFSVQLASQSAERRPIRDLLSWMSEHPSEDLSVEALAARAAMSARNFARVFRQEVGFTPARYVERTRVEAARRRLEEGDAGVDAIAEASGFGSAETMRRAFLRNLEVGPAEYRNRFRTVAA